MIVVSYFQYISTLLPNFSEKSGSSPFIKLERVTFHIFLTSDKSGDNLLTDSNGKKNLFKRRNYNLYLFKGYYNYKLCEKSQTIN